MYIYYRVSLLVSIICFYMYDITYSAHPKCNKKCCDEAKEYDRKSQDRELCVFKCYLVYVLSDMKNDGEENSLLKCFSNSNNRKTRRLLNECLKKCPKSPPKGCGKECCKEREMILTNRRNDPKACCEGKKQIKDRNVRDEDVIDCRMSDQSCSNIGFLLLYSNNTTVCLSSNSNKTDLGMDFPYSDECWQLDKYSSDRNQNYWNEAS